MMKGKKKGLVLPEYILEGNDLKNGDTTKKINEIVQSINQIYDKNASKLSFQTLYSNGYQVVLHKKGDELYERVKKTIAGYVAGLRDRIMKQVDSVFLEQLLSKWKEHTTALQMVRDILMYLDRTYVQSTKKIPIYELGVQLFGKQVFQKKALDRILRLIMSIIQKERNGEIVSSQFQLKDLCKMMLQISKKDIYITHFENTFIKTSRNFFQTEASYYFQNNTSTVYLDKVLQRLKGERRRAKRCFDKETVGKIENVVKTEMIEKYKNAIISKEGSGCSVMLKEWKIKDLKRVYDVLGLVKGALNPLLVLIGDFSRKEGEAIIKEKDSNPLEMIQDLIKLWEKYDNLLNVSFSKKMSKSNDVIRDEEFCKVIRNSFSSFLNGHERIPEYLSLYIDSKLRVGKYTIEESEFDVLFEQVIRLFRHLKERDYFEKYYKIHLGKRLLGNKSQSHEAERSFISKLKAEFGYQFTSKIEGMFTDIRLNSETMTKFKKYYQTSNGKEKLGMDLSVRVLTSGYWPMPTKTSIVINLPEHIQKSIDFFDNFYMNAHSGRKLSWKINLGTIDLKMNGFARPYELEVSTMQYIIMNCFNGKKKTLTFKEIQTISNIPTKDLKHGLKALLSKNKTHGKVLLKQKCPKITDSTKFQPNEKFQSKMIRVKILQTKMKQSKEDVKRTTQKIDEERKWQLDACVVRIMKMRKKFEHRNLIPEVIKQLQSRFIPTPDIIKKRIESLIEREYIKRSPENRTVYTYVA